MKLTEFDLFADNIRRIFPLDPCNYSFELIVDEGFAQGIEEGVVVSQFVTNLIRWKIKRLIDLKSVILEADAQSYA